MSVAFDRELAKLGNQHMDAISLITWLFFELIFASVGFVIVKTIVFSWRLFRFAVSGGQEAMGPLITAALTKTIFFALFSVPS